MQYSCTFLPDFHFYDAIQDEGGVKNFGSINAFYYCLAHNIIKIFCTRYKEMDIIGVNLKYKTFNVLGLEITLKGNTLVIK